MIPKEIKYNMHYDDVRGVGVTVNSQFREIDIDHNVSSILDVSLKHSFDKLLTLNGHRFNTKILINVKKNNMRFYITTPLNLRFVVTSNFSFSITGQASRFY